MRGRDNDDRFARRSSFVRVYPRTVIYHSAPTVVQYVQLPQVVQRPVYVYPTYPQMVTYSVMPSQLYNYYDEPYYNGGTPYTYYEPSYYNQPYYGQTYYNDPYQQANYNDNCNYPYGDQYGNQYGNCDDQGNYYGQYANYPQYNVYGAPFGNSLLQGVVVANQGSSLLVMTSNLKPVIVDAGFANQNGGGIGNVAPGTMIEAVGFYQGNTFVATALN